MIFFVTALKEDYKGEKHSSFPSHHSACSRGNVLASYQVKRVRNDLNGGLPCEKRSCQVYSSQSLPRSFPSPPLSTTRSRLASSQMIRKFKGTEEGPGKSPSLSSLFPSILPPTTIASFLPLAALALYFYESGSEEERM